MRLESPFLDVCWELAALEGIEIAVTVIGTVTGSFPLRFGKTPNNTWIPL
jgi:hypothetical protein